MALQIDDIVRVSASIRAGGLTREEFGRGLFVGTSDVLDAGGSGKVRAFARLADVADVFDTTDEEYLAAVAWFGQNPRPKNLLIARWAQAAVPTTITGGAPAAAATIGAISDGSISIGGVDFTSIDLSSSSTYALQATALQTALRMSSDSRFTGVTVTYSSPSFVISFPNGADVGGVAEAVSPTSGTDLAASMSFDSGSGAVYVQGNPAETIAECMDSVLAQQTGWYFVMHEKAYHGTATMGDLATWVEANNRFFFAGDAEVGALVANEATSQAALLSARRLTRTAIVWSRTADYKSVSIAARLAGVDFSAPSSLITTKFKQLPGFAGDTLTTAQRNELVRKRINYYTSFSGDTIFAEGHALATNVWIDQQYWLDWLVYTIEIEVWNLLRRSPAVPQTPAGIVSLRNTITGVLEEGVANGGIAPGTASPDLTLDIRQSLPDPAFNGVLSLGYLLWIGLLSAQSQTDREARRSPPIKIWLKGRGAIHEVAITLVFSQ